MSVNFIKKRRDYLIIAMILTVIIIVLLPVEIPDSISVPAKILPEKEFLLQRQADGSLLATSKNNLRNIIESYTAYQVERGDVLHFMLSNGLSAGSRVSAGDTIGSVISNETERRIARLEGELATVQANLMLNMTGEKQAVVQAAEDQLALSRERLEVQQNIHKREEQLYKQNLTSLQNLEIVRGTTRIYELEVTMAEAQLLALKTGSKPEQIRFIEAEISAKKEELAILQERLRDSYIRSTVQGRILNIFSQDTLLVIGDSSSIVIAAVPVVYAAEIKEGQQISVSAVENVKGSVLRTAKRTEMIGGRQVIMIAATVNDHMDVPHGLLTNCRIRLAPKTIFRHIINILKTLFV